MTAPVAGTPAPSPSAASKGPILGKEDFLSMLVAQLRNQDPMNPMDGAEYAAQLAQFSTVEQLLEIGSKLDAQSVDIAEGVLVGQTQLGATLIGREVVLRGAELSSDGERPGRLALELPEGAASVGIEVFDSTGQRVGTQSFSSLPAGRSMLTLDGVGLPEGTYTYKVTALDTSGKAANYEAFQIGLVEGMAFLNGQVALRIGSRLVPMLDIVEILAAAQAADPTSPIQEPDQP